MRRPSKPPRRLRRPLPARQRAAPSVLRQSASRSAAGRAEEFRTYYLYEGPTRYALAFYMQYGLANSTPQGPSKPHAKQSSLESTRRFPESGHAVTLTLFTSCIPPQRSYRVSSHPLPIIDPKVASCSTKECSQSRDGVGPLGRSKS